MTGRKLTVGSRAVAVAILSEAINAARKKIAAANVDDGYGAVSPQLLAEELVTEAWDVEYKPNAERLVMVFDAGIDYDTSRGVPTPTE